MGRLLQQLSQRHRDGHEVVMNAKEMGQVLCVLVWVRVGAWVLFVGVYDSHTDLKRSGTCEGQVVDALERLNDYMVGHIRYEEEVTMPWLRSGL